MNTLILTLFLMVVTAVDGAGEYNIDHGSRKTSRFLTDSVYNNRNNAEAITKTSFIEESTLKTTDSTANLSSENNNEDQSKKSQFNIVKVRTPDGANNMTFSKLFSAYTFGDQKIWNLLNDKKNLTAKSNLLKKNMQKNENLKLLPDFQKSGKAGINDISLYTIKKQLEDIVRNNSDIINGKSDNKYRKTIKNIAQFDFQKQYIKRSTLYNLLTIKKDESKRNTSYSVFHAKDNSATFGKLENVVDKDKLDNSDEKINTNYFQNKVPSSKDINSFGLNKTLYSAKSAEGTDRTLKFNEKHFVNFLSTLKIRDFRKIAEILNKSDLKSILSNSRVQKYNNTPHSIERRNNFNISSAYQFKTHNVRIPVHFQGRNIKKRELESYSKTNQNNGNNLNRISNRKLKKINRTSKKSHLKPTKRAGGGIWGIITDTTASLVGSAIKGFLKLTVPVIIRNLYKFLDDTGELGDLGFFMIYYSARAVLSGIVTGPIVAVTGILLHLVASIFDTYILSKVSLQKLIDIYKYAINKFDDEIGIVKVINTIVAGIKTFIY